MNEDRKKLYKRLGITAGVLIVLAVFCYLLAYSSCLRVMDSKINDRNGEAIQCLKAAELSVEEVYSGKSIPGGEFILRGNLGSNGMTNEPGKLISTEKNMPYSIKSGTLYWAVRFSGGKAAEAWCAPWRLSDNELRAYTKEEQRSEYKKDVWKRGSEVIGYYSKTDAKK